MISTADPTCPRTGRAGPPAGRSRSRPAPSSSCAGPGEGHLPAPARPRHGLRAGARARALPARARRQPPVPLPGAPGAAGSTHGYDVIDPRRVSDDLGGEAALRELAGAGLDVLLDVVPNHMATDDENPFWADPGLRERFFDIDPETGLHRRFFSIDELAGVRVEDPEVFEATHALILRLVAEGVVDGLRDRPPRRPRRSRRATSRGWPSAGVERIWVEKIIEPGELLPDWPVEGTTGYEFMADATAPLHRSRRRGAAHRPLRRADRRDAALRGAGRRGEAGGGAHDLPARGRAPAGAARRAGHGRGGRRPCRSTAPTWSPRPAPTTTPTTWRRWRRPSCPTACARPSWLRPTPTRRRSRCASSRPPGPSWPRASRTRPSTATPGSSR